MDEFPANGTKIGNARVVGQAWDITDLNGYAANAGWTYTAKVVNTSTNSSGAVATQGVTTDLTEGAPVITGVFDSDLSSATTLANNGSTYMPITKVSGTASANALIYLYDNTSTNLVGTAVADASGNWSVSGFGVLPSTNTFSAKQIDVNGNESGLSNLWNVTTTASGGFNGNFDSGATTGFASDIPLDIAGTTFNYIRQRFAFNIIDKPIAYTNGIPQTGFVTLTPSAPATWANGTWTQKTFNAPTGATVEETDASWNTFLSLAKGKIMVGSGDGYGGVGELGTVWGSQVDVVQGQTYTFHFDYWNTAMAGGPSVTAGTFLIALIDGVKVMATSDKSTGSVDISYTANKTGPVDLTLAIEGWGNGADFAIDNVGFAASVPNNGSLVPGAHPGFTDSADGSLATPIVYNGGPMDALGGNDVLGVATGVNLQTALSTGGSYIDGGAGVDTLVLNAGTTLNLNALVSNQTVHALQQVEIFKLQGTSTLTLSANDVLSLGGANASTMSGYTFAGSTGKVQLVVDATSTDNLVLTPLTTDGVTTNSLVGNTGLAGTWTSAGTATIGGTTYQVYNHSTTDAQVLVAGGATVNPNGNVNSGQSVAITNVETTGAGSAYVEEFNSGISAVGVNTLTAGVTPTYTTTSAINTAASNITTGAWNISTVDIWNSWQANLSYAPVNELYLRTGATTPTSTTATTANTLLGTDGRLQLGLDANEFPTGSGDGRLYTFESLTGPFTAISFKSWGLENRVYNSSPIVWNYPEVDFFDAKGNVVYRQDFTTLSSNTLTDNFVVNLPSGVTATSFSFRTINADRWFMDELSMTPVTNASLLTNGTTTDATPLLSGTYALSLSSGDVIKVYDGATFVGTATVDPLSKTWTLQLTAAQTVGSHTYTAKIESMASATVATSNSFNLNVLAPVVLDMNHDGQLSYSQIKMDLNSDGILDTTSWVAAQDGLLVHDVYGDGSVRSNSQFAFARHGGETDLQGLAAQFDSNHDGVLDAKDAQFGEMAVWQDTNQNGLADAGEMKHLVDLGISDIKLTSDGVVRTPAAGVTEAGHTTAQLADGSTMVVADAGFNYQLGTADASGVVGPVQAATNVAAPTHCDETWVAAPVDATGTTVYSLDTSAWQNKPYTLSAAQMAELKLPTPADGSVAAQFQLKALDVLLAPVDAAGNHVVQVTGDSNDKLSLSSLLGTDATPGQWTATGTVQQGDMTFNTYVYSADNHLQVMVDQHLQHVTLS